MSAHTPGPWEIVNCRSGYPRQIRSSDKSRLLMSGACYDVTRWNSLSMPLSAEGQANARLIAAAPELLEALSTLLDHCERMGFNTREERPLLAAARSAIAKAAGSPA